MTVGLTWDGQYDQQGKRAGPVKIALPFQTIETVNESGQSRARQLDLFSQGRQTEWRNRLIWGDKKYVLPSLLPDFAGKVNLIYIDPPFATGADFSFTTAIPESDETITKEPGMIEQKAYRDTWGRGLDSYLQWFYETVVLLHELLADDGSIYVHLDDNIGHYAKVILDEVFGIDSYQNEVIWQRTDPHNDARNKFGNIHDTIFWYGKGLKPSYNHEAVRTKLSQSGLAEYSLLELDDGSIITFAGNEHLGGRRFKLDDATWKGSNPQKKFAWRGATPSRNREWMYTYEEMEEALAQRRLYLRDPNKGAARCKKSYLDENQGILLQDIWNDAGRMKGGSRYATEKPEALLERIIKASSNEGDLVLDCFCGSGTTAAVAEKLGRRGITCDLGRFAIHTARKRLLSIPNVKPFVVQNLGKYERQAWQAAEFGQGDTRAAAEAQAAYRRFILALYHATPISGYAWLHGARGGRLVHVGAVDAPVAQGDVRSIVREFWRAQGATTNGVDILGWDFAFDLNEVIRQQAAQANVQVAFKRIPREVLEKKAVDQGDIKFYELAALGVAVGQKASDLATAPERERGPRVTVTLTDFVVADDEIPADVIGAVTHWSQWIDYWAVDWENHGDAQGDAFHNMSQTYRTRTDPKIQLSLAHTYDQPGDYTILIKVIDLLGNDTTKAVRVEVTT